jgi:hypothetical protein
MDHHAFLPFILGWLLCLLLYLERSRRSLLFAAGLVLGIGAFTYIASYLFMPAYFVMTCLVLLQRREPLNSYVALAGGFLAPLVVGGAYIAMHPAVISDTLWRYQRNKPQVAGGLTQARSLLSVDRFAKVGSVYWSYWNPRVLFITGPRAIWVAGQFVLPVAGLLVAAAIRLVRRADARLLLLLAGLLLAPIPASFIGEPEVIRRAAGVMPFGILLAAAGLDEVWNTRSAGLRRLLFLLVWTTVIALGVLYYTDIPHAQAIVRASSVPLAIAGLALIVAGTPVERASGVHMAIVSALVVATVHFVYLIANQGTPIGVALLVVVCCAVLLPRAPTALTQSPLIGVALLALIASHFMFNYVDYSQIGRVGAIPASALILVARLVASAIAVALALAIAVAVRRIPSAPPVRWQTTAAVITGLVVLQLAYYYVDFFTDFRPRAVMVLLVFALGVGVAALAGSGESTTARLGPIATAGLLVVGLMQFAPFYADYLGGFRARGAGVSGTERELFDAVIERTRTANVPAIYLGWPYHLGDLYWRFYQVRAHREDLEARTIPDLDFKPDRIATLPRGSLVITTPSPNIDRAIDDLTTRGVLDPKRTLLRDIDGVPAFWILETAH